MIHLVSLAKKNYAAVFVDPEDNSNSDVGCHYRGNVRISECMLGFNGHLICP